MPLLASQLSSYSRICNILSTYSAYLDTSPTGAGKTYITCIAARDLGYSLFVVAPKGTLTNWEKVADEVGADLLTAITYSAFRGTNKGIVQHSALIRNDDGTYSATEQLRESKDILFVFDESQNVKNWNTSTRKAVTKLSQNLPDSCRIALLSASPYDKGEHAKSYLFCMGIVRSSDKIYEWDFESFEYVQLGSQDLCDYVYRMLPREEARRIVCSPEQFNKQTVNSLCTNIYRNIALRFQSTYAPLPQDCVSIDGAHTFVRFPEEQQGKIQEALDLMRTYKKKDPTTGKTFVDFSSLTKGFEMLEDAKIDTLVDISCRTLENKKQSKVLLFLNFLGSIDRAKELFEEKGYKVATLTGKTSKDWRKTIQDKFQEPSNVLRVLVSNVTVGGVGIDLDDKHGDFPRYAFFSPNYKFIDILQATGRVCRANTMSTPTVRLFYSGAGERRILENISTKSLTTKSTLKQEDSFMPGDYKEYEHIQDPLLRSFEE
jgi:hypothetical protein